MGVIVKMNGIDVTINGIQVERLSGDGLRCENWQFDISTAYGETSAVQLLLAFYGKGARSSTRQKFEFDPKNRFVSADRSADNSGIKPAAVPIPGDVLAEAKSKIDIQFMPIE